jgi:hypothetical protein
MKLIATNKILLPLSLIILSSSLPLFGKEMWPEEFVFV